LKAGIAPIMDRRYHGLGHPIGVAATVIRSKPPLHGAWLTRRHWCM